jgi:hypothetical protein
MTQDEFDLIHPILSDAEQIVARFSVMGTGVAGNIEDGYTVNPPEGSSQSSDPDE